MTILKEGGNIWPDQTQRINQGDVESTVQFVEKVTGLPLVDNMLGTTGKKATSGDLDLAVDVQKNSKADIEAKLKAWVSENHPDDDPKEWIKKSGISVHFKTPIKGDEANGFVQTDLMFGDPEWMKFALTGSGEGSEFKGVHRHILLSSIAKQRIDDNHPEGLKWSTQAGLVDRATNETVTKDGNQIAKMLLGQTATVKDITSVENIINYVKKLPNYEELVADAREAFAKDGLELPKAGQVESFQPGSIGWMRQMIDIVS